jgi:hypothetical protein
MGDSKLAINVNIIYHVIKSIISHHVLETFDGRFVGYMECCVGSVGIPTHK